MAKRTVARRWAAGYFSLLIATICAICAISASPAEAGEGQPSFANVTAAVGIDAPHHLTYFASGQAWADVDRDGYHDLYLTDNDGPNLLYRSNGSGADGTVTFSLSPISGDVSLPDAASGGATFADYDNDGWPDLYVLNLGANKLFRNLGGTGFEDVSAIAGIGDLGMGESATWGDYDGDGDLDLYSVNWWYAWNDPDHPLKRDTLYRNNGAGVGGIVTFSDVTELLDLERTAGPGYAATFVDFDNDGDQDLYVVNDKEFGNPLWRNDGPGCGGWCFTDVSVASGADRPAWGMGIAAGDYDRDGDFDFYYSSIGEMILLQNQISQGSPTFIEVSIEAGVSIDTVGWGSVFVDYDNDSWPDLYLSTDTADPAKANRLYRNLGDGTFEDVSEGSGASIVGRSMGVASCDYDLDGRVDLVVGNVGEQYHLLRNLGVAGAGNHWLAMRLEGGGPVNRDAIGARVELTLTGGATLMQEVKSDSSLGSGNDLGLHFGLGDALPQSARVVWPDGTEIVVDSLPVDRLWQLKYPSYADFIFIDGFESGDTSAWN